MHNAYLTYTVRLVVYNSSKSLSSTTRTSCKTTVQAHTTTWKRWSYDFSFTTNCAQKYCAVWIGLRESLRCVRHVVEAQSATVEHCSSHPTNQSLSTHFFLLFCVQSTTGLISLITGPNSSNLVKPKTLLELEAMACSCGGLYSPTPTAIDFMFLFAFKTFAAAWSSWKGPSSYPSVKNMKTFWTSSPLTPCPALIVKSSTAFLRPSVIFVAADLACFKPLMDLISSARSYVWSKLILISAFDPYSKIPTCTPSLEIGKT